MITPKSHDPIPSQKIQYKVHRTRSEAMHAFLGQPKSNDDSDSGHIYLRYEKTQALTKRQG